MIHQLHTKELARVLLPSEVARISRWATESLTPTLTVIMDLPAEIGLGRLHSTDRLESEPLAFHERVRQEYLNLAHLDPERFLVVDASFNYRTNSSNYY